MNTTEYSNFPLVSLGDIGGAPVQTVKGRQLHAVLRNRDHFATWIKDRIDQYDFAEDVDFTTFSEVSEKGGRPRTEYALSIDMAKEVAMVERNPQGRAVRQYFIECERRAKDPLAALNDPAAMRGLLLSYSEKVLDLQGKLELAGPKTAFYDQFINSDGLYGLQNAGRALNARPNLFIRWLKENYLFYQGGNLVARVQYIQMGIFEVKSTIVDDKVRPQAYVTPKGLGYLAQRIPDEIKMAGAA